MNDIKVFKAESYLSEFPVTPDTLPRSESFFRKPILTPESIGTDAIGMALFVLPAGQRTQAHVHAEDSHTAIYVVSGTGTSHIGEKGEKVHRTHPGDVIYIPPGVKHYKVNDGQDAIVAAVVRTNVYKMALDQED